MKNQFKFSTVSLMIVCVILLLQAGCVKLQKILDDLAMKRNDAHILATHFDATNAVIVDGRAVKPGGTLFYIEKDNGKWDIKQTIDLDDILIEHSPLSVVCNGQWMVLTAIPKIKKDLAKIILFKKIDGEWNLVSTPDCMEKFIFTNSFKHLLGGEPRKKIAISSDNQLFIAQIHAEKGKVFRFDLNTEPISLQETILPPENGVGPSSIEYFGMAISLKDDCMHIDAAGEYFSEEEFEKYGIIEADFGIALVKGKRPLPRKNSLFVYKLNRETNRWEYATDFFDLMPHPPGEIIRQPTQIKHWLSKGKTILYNPIEQMRLRFLTSNRVFLTSEFAFYDFKAIDGSSWVFDKKILPHTLPLERNKIQSTTNYTFNFEIGEKYSIFFRGYPDSEDIGCLDFYLTGELEDWKPLWKVAFDTEYWPAYIAALPMDQEYVRKFSINLNFCKIAFCIVQ